MKAGFYSRLAWNNIKKNAALYVPNVLAGMGLTGVFYILSALAQDQSLRKVPGGGYLATLMPFGVIVLAVLSLILILYTNSFLMKQRNREFGLYNVLGMEKRHIGKILFWETAISSFFVLLGGLVAGIILYKLCTLLICRILAADGVPGLYFVSLKALVLTGGFFFGVYLLTYLFNRIRIARMNPTELLQSTHTGEREPKVKWPLLLIGLVSLGGGYAISIATKDPLNAIGLFFVAVMLVILGTYCLFVAGSIVLLKVMKRNQRFYYHKKHMIAVSGLFYRMKQNAVGLASIAILATMVLVMVSTTVSMYSGIQDTVNRQYPHQITLSAGYYVDGEKVDVPRDDFLAMARKSAEDTGLTLSFTQQQRYLSNAFGWDGETLWMNRNQEGGSLIECWFITAQEYYSLTGESLNLAENQIAVYGLPENSQKIEGSIWIGDREFELISGLNGYPIFMGKNTVVDSFGFVVSNEDVFAYIQELQEEVYSDDYSVVSSNLILDFADEDAAADACDVFLQNLRGQLQQYVDENPASDGKYSLQVNSKWDAMETMKGMYGTLLFLGLMLSVIFLFATALIIYYKQISEGYEDRSRFQIMQKVGMSEAEVKGAIHSQIRLVFFLPLLVAAVHLAFVFPILTRMPEVLFQSNKVLVIGCMLASLGIFATIYTLIYSLTAKRYYKIVKR